MWGWLVIVPALALLLYVSLLKRELRKLKHRVQEIPANAGYGSRLFVDFREKAVIELVDELNRMIDAFEEKNRQAKRMEDNVKLTIAGLSHDLRTPLTSIHGYVQLLQTASDETKKAQYLTIVEQSVHRLMEMNDHFYDLARMETNQKEMALSSVSLSNMVEEVFLSFYEPFEEKQIAIQFPEQPSDRPIIADPILLLRVIQNIVQNILRYANSKAVIGYGNEGNHVVFSVKNDIRPDSKVVIEKVFTRFYTEDASRTNAEASGLGLYLSKRLVEMMGGKMDAALDNNWFILTIHLPVNPTPRRA